MYVIIEAVGDSEEDTSTLLILECWLLKDSLQYRWPDTSSKKALQTKMVITQSWSTHTFLRIFQSGISKLIKMNNYLMTDSIPTYYF